MTAGLVWKLHHATAGADSSRTDVATRESFFATRVGNARWVFASGNSLRLPSSACTKIYVGTPDISDMSKRRDMGLCVDQVQALIITH